MPSLNCSPPFVAVFALVASSLLASEDDRARELFEKKIRPTLLAKCVDCHGAEEQEAGLRVDSKQGWMVGGDSGPAIVPGDPDASLLIRAIRYSDPALQMPPEGKLSEQELKAFEQWVRWGAADPRVEVVASTATDEPKPEASWAFQSLTRPQVPTVATDSWARTDIDQFVLAEMETRGLEPVAKSAPSTLLRRLYYDLIGLPPTPAEIDRFVADPSDQARRNVVDTLLDSPHFGERWGRRWLDVVRFAESSGGGRTLLFPNAWRYRDYVIDAFNADRPYDEFVTEQLAGDLLPSENAAERRRHLVATAFLLLGPTNFEQQDKDILEMDIIDEQLDTIGKALLGMTIGCARCHDHKFDPVTTHDYYGLAGIFKSTEVVVHDNVSKWHTVVLPQSESEPSESDSMQTELAALEAELARAKSANPESASEESVARLEKKLMALRKKSEARRVAMAVAEAEQPGDIAIAIRGQAHNRGPVVARSALSAVTQVPLDPIPDNCSGRRALAEWITDPAHPLTARVIVNRVWHWLMGRGLVTSVDNFGKMGEAPSHPELLDYLAVGFVEDGWSIKRLIRRITDSSVYQLSAEQHLENSTLDPDNRWFWRMHRRRLEAEELRDTLLFVSGQLDLTQGGPNIKPGTGREYGYRFESRRRSVYVPVFRNTLPELFEVFDFADPNMQSGRRATSTTAPQALLLMNHPFVIAQAQAAAERLLQTKASRSQRIEFAYRQVLGRAPTDREADLAVSLLETEAARGDSPLGWTLLYQSLFQCLDFRYLN